MKLVDDGAVMQARLSLRHVHRVLNVMSSSECLCNLLLMICYTTSSDAALAAQTQLNNVLSSTDHRSQVSTNQYLTFLSEKLLLTPLTLTFTLMYHTSKCMHRPHSDAIPIYRARQKNNNPLEKILYLWNCCRLFHQICSLYRRGFRPHILQILLK